MQLKASNTKNNQKNKEEFDGFPPHENSLKNKNGSLGKN
jgi:hypothetical protein